MKISKPHIINKLILIIGKLNHYRYHSSVNHVERAQKRKLLHYLSSNSQTIFGEKHDFKGIKNYTDFAAKVPITEDWAQIEAYIQRIEKGEQNVLFKDKIDAFEETSGSTGFSKLIPYNKSLQKEFQKAIQVWMLDLCASSPRAFYGKSYWSLSPALKEKRLSVGGIRIGLENDTDYFNPVVGYFLKQTMAVSSSIAHIKERHGFYFETVKQLLLEKNLSFISVWSPTFFLQLDEFLKANIDQLLVDISIINKKRHNEIIKAIQTDFSWKSIWPYLACISCWTDAQASSWIPQVKKVTGDVLIQPKGLLSTEAVVSIPINSQPYPALAYRSHFFEFRNIDDQTILLAHQLLLDACYEIIVTTAGGLYRYATKDVVRICGFYGQVPLFKFLGRQNRTSDLVGEKVNEIQVNEIIQEITKEEALNIYLIFVRAERMEQSATYTLYIEKASDIKDDQLAKILRRFEQMLCKNPYYKQALGTGQLKPMQLKTVSSGFKEKLVAYYRQAKSITDGDIKLPMLFLEHELKGLNHLL